ncbi:MAG: Maf family protein [Coriobacteriales bacterium]|jgi:septum formation protein|nr:Maf family protein [Coriobacteriales bacterium]
MRKMAFVSAENETGLKKVMLCACGNGVYLYGYDTIVDCNSVLSEWYEKLDEAERHCVDVYHIQADDWISVPEPLDSCNHDYLMPVRIKGRDIGRPEFDTWEILTGGEWRPFRPPYDADATEGANRIEVILASGSPRREAILRAHGIVPTVVLPQVDERLADADGGAALAPGDRAEALALRKANDVYRCLVADGPPGSGRMPSGGSDALPQGAVVVAADTIVYKENVGVLGKPEGHDEAVAMLEALRNAAHQVYTGVAVIRMPGGETTSFVDVSTVRFGDYSSDDIEAFLKAEPPYDKAGAYAAQGMWARHITRIDGDLENVIGLPWHRLADLLTSF